MKTISSPEGYNQLANEYGALVDRYLEIFQSDFFHLRICELIRKMNTPL